MATQSAPRTYSPFNEPSIKRIPYLGTKVQRLGEGCGKLFRELTSTPAGNTSLMYLSIFRTKLPRYIPVAQSPALQFMNKAYHLPIYGSTRLFLFNHEKLFVCQAGISPGLYRSKIVSSGSFCKCTRLAAVWPMQLYPALREYQRKPRKDLRACCL